MGLDTPRWWLTGLAAILAAAAISVAVVLAIGDDEGAAPLARVPPGDPSPVFETAARRALPSVVQIQQPSAVGSGVVYNDHDVVTNAHVVAGAQRFMVVTSDGKEHPATLRGAFPEDDLAVVRVSDGGLTPARFGDSSKLQVGQAVLAIGSPLGLRGSVTEGVVSAVSRTVTEPNGVAIPSAIQTSAAINPGNSGGGLVDTTGAVVGIPTVAAVSPGAGGPAPGVGLAISSNTAKRVAGQLVAHGRVVDTGRAWLGVELRSVLGGGVLIVGVVRGGPAAKAGLAPGDVIVSIDGQPVMSVENVAALIAAHKPGDRAQVKVRHQDGSEATVQVTLGELPAAG
jgi:putative serine protease PepD